LREVNCGYDNAQSSVGKKTVTGLGLSYPDSLVTADGIAALSLAMKHGSCCSLPFCCTVEGEALGADVCMGDDTAGPRAAGDPAWEWQKPLVFPAVDFSEGRIGAALSACRLLKQRGESVVLEISGPITVLNCFMDLSTLFKTWRKRPEWVEDALRQLKLFHLQYMRHASEAGADLICYADPVGSYSILGPRYAKELMRKYVVPLLRRIEAGDNVASGVHICPKTVQMLTEYGFAQWERVAVGTVADYARGCLTAAGKSVFFGEACLKNTGYQPENGEIKTLRLRNDDDVFSAAEEKLR